MSANTDSDRAAWRAWTEGSCLLTLLDLMQIIKADALHRLGVFAGSIDGICDLGPVKEVKSNISDELRKKLVKSLPDYRETCVDANLRISAMALDDLISQVKDRTPPSLTFETLRAALNELSNTLHRELKCITVLCLNPKRSEFYKATNLFGGEVARNFPSTTFDIEEAGNCLATERSTAAVFHLIRVIEVGLQALGKTLNVPHLDPRLNPTWEAILGKCDAELKKTRKDRSPDWQADPDFFSEATARLRSVKDAWRNPTMHIQKKYMPDEAQDIYNAVRTFMRHLATKLAEPDPVPAIEAIPRKQNP